MGSTTFSDNRAWYGGAIFNREIAPPSFDDEEIEGYETPTITFPTDTVFSGNSAEVSTFTCQLSNQNVCRVEQAFISPRVDRVIFSV